MKTYFAKILMLSVASHLERYVEAKFNKGKYSVQALYHNAIISINMHLLKLCVEEGADG